jgi:hypothetical protein
MQQTELLVVQLQEAKAYLSADSNAERRLGLILTDNAVELLLQQEAEKLLWLNESKGELIRMMEAYGDSTYVDRDLLEESRKEYVTPKRKSRIENEFSAKVGFLVDRSSLSPAEGAVLIKLHQYRNETYHRGKLRPGSLQTCAGLYFDIACDLLGRFTQLMSQIIVKSQALDLFPKLAEELEGFDDRAWITQTSFGSVLSRNDPPNRSISDSLADHLIERIDGLVGMAIDQLEYFGPEWTAEDIFHGVQLPHAQGIEKIRGEKVKYPFSRVTKWRVRAERVRAVPGRLEAFRLFAKLEDEIEPIEDLLNEFAIEMDRAVQQKIDELRGK